MENDTLLHADKILIFNATYAASKWKKLRLLWWTNLVGKQRSTLSLYCKRKSTWYSLNCQHLLLTKNKQQIDHKCVLWITGTAFSHILTGHPTQPLSTMLWLSHEFLLSLMWQNVHFHLCCQFVYFVQITIQILSALLESSWCFCVLSCHRVFSRKQHRSKTITHRLSCPSHTFRLQSNKM